MAESFVIKVKTLNGKVIEVKVPNAQCTIPALKVYITEQTGTPASDQKLIFQGKVLRDDKTVADYSLKDGSTIHLVKKPALEQPPTSTSQTQTPSASSSSSPSPASNFPGPNIVMGTISLPEGSGGVTPPNLSQIIGNVLGSFGVPNPLASNTQAPSNQAPPVDAFNQLRQNLDTLATNISQIQGLSGSAIPNSTSSSSTPPTQTEIVGQSLSRMVSSFNQMAPFISSLGSVLQSESTLANSSARQDAQRLAHQLAPIFHQFGHIILTLGTSLQGLRMNANPNSAQVPPPHRPILASATVGTANIGDPRQAPPNIQLSQLRVPLFSVAPPAPGGNNPPANLTSVLSGVANTLQTPANASSSTAPQTQSTTTSSQPTPPPPPVASNTTSAPPNPFAALMSQLFSSVAQSVTPPSNEASSSPASSPDLSAMMAQLMGGGIPSSPPNSNAPSQQETSVGSVVDSLAQGMSTPANQTSEDSIMGDLLHHILEALTISDIVAIMNGQLEPLQRAHPSLQAYLKDLLKGDESPASFQRIADAIVEALDDSLREANLPEDIKQKIRPGYDITLIARHTIHKYSLHLLKVIHSNYEVSSSSPSPFALAVKEWTAAFTEELVSRLAQCMHNGVSDVAQAIKFFLQQRLAFLGPEVAQNTTTIATTHILNAYSQTHGSIDWKEPVSWKRLTDVDEIRQAHMRPQRPFSDSYLSGVPAKRRKLSPTTADIEKVFQENLMESFKNSNIKSKDLSAPGKEEVIQAFTEKLTSDLQQRAKSDPDYQPTRFQKTASLFKD